MAGFAGWVIFIFFVIFVAYVFWNASVTMPRKAVKSVVHNEMSSGGSLLTVILYIVGFIVVIAGLCAL